MPIEILMPALSPTMEEGTLAKWLVSEGDEVSSGDILAEIETDKATMEFEAVDEGKIGKLLISEGSAGVKVNTPIAVLLEDGETASDIQSTPSAPSLANEPTGSAATSAPTANAGSPEQSIEKPSGDRVFATPLARRIAADKGIDLKTVTGSGPRGRIVKADVENLTAAASKSAGTTPTAATPSTATIPSSPGADAIMKLYEGRKYEEVALDGMRRTVAARLTEAKQTIPHFYLRRDIELDALL